MNALATPEIIGIGAVALGFGTLFWKLWQSHQKITERVIDIADRNTKSHEKLYNVIDGLDTSIKSNTNETKASKQATDKFTTLLVQILQNQNDNRKP